MKKYNNPIILGVTGGMGSGQSTVCKFFTDWGCKVINADEKARFVIGHSKVLQKDLRKVFGNDIFYRDGKLNRARLAELAFKDELQTRKLNQLVHPRMVESLVDEMEKARFSGRYPIIVIDAALIYEISIERIFDEVLVVWAPLDQRQKRVLSRDNLTKEQFFERISKQIDLDEKKDWGDFLIKNSSSMDALEKKTRAVYDKLMSKQTAEFAKPRPRRRRPRKKSAN